MPYNLPFGLGGGQDLPSKNIETIEELDALKASGALDKYYKQQEAQ